MYCEQNKCVGCQSLTIFLITCNATYIIRILLIYSVAYLLKKIMYSMNYVTISWQYYILVQLNLMERTRWIIWHAIFCILINASLKSYRDIYIYRLLQQKKKNIYRQKLQFNSKRETKFPSQILNQHEEHKNNLVKMFEYIK